MKKLLIVTPNFPPINAPDMQRVRMSLPYYRANGWDPVILAVGDRWQSGVREPALQSALPGDIRIVRVPAVPRGLSRWAGVGNIGLRTWPFLLWDGTKLLRKEKFDLVFFSTTQFVTFTLGPFWKRWLGVPYVLDVQDPWWTAHYERPGSRPPPGGWKYRFARLQARLLEGWTFGGAAAVMSVSPTYLDDLGKRYPGFAAKPSAVIRFGASRDDVARARTLPNALPVFSRDNGERHLVYTGASGPIDPRALTILFSALRSYREHNPARARRLRFHFIGTSYVEPGQGRPSVLPIAERCGVQDLVTEVSHRIGFFDSLRLQQEADALLLLASGDPAYSPSKLYTYYLTGRPILGLVYRGSVLEGLLDELSCAFMVRVSDTGPGDDDAAGLHRFFDLAVGGFATDLPHRDNAHFSAHFLAEELTRRQCALFDEALTAHDGRMS